MHPIQWNDSKRLVTIDGKTIQLTPIEYRLLFLLRHRFPVSHDELASSVYRGDVGHKTRIAMDKHIDRIRGKLRDTNISVHCVLSYGYILIYEAKEKPQGVLAYNTKENN